MDIPLPSANARVEERRGEAFAQGTWKFDPDWLLEAGACFEYSKISETGDTTQSRTFFYPKPRAVLTWSIDKNTQLRARYERVVGQLDFGDFIATSDLSSSGVTAGNPTLKPDQRTSTNFPMNIISGTKARWLFRYCMKTSPMSSIRCRSTRRPARSTRRAISATAPMTRSRSK